MEVGASAAMLIAVALIVGFVVGSRWRHAGRSRADYRTAKSGVGKTRTTWFNAMRDVLLPGAALLLLIYLVMSNLR